MRQAEIEFWALRIIDTVKSGSRVEDSRVELKGEMPDPMRAARRLAGHANAARGEEILWLLGVDEQQGVVGVNPDDLANWWSVTSANFKGPVPTLTPVTIHQASATVLALLVETASAPFVVKNPVYGTPGGGPVELEVPWREMTRIRSAEHSDLIRLLVPQLKLPLIEVLSAGLSGYRPDAFGAVTTDFGPKFRWRAMITLYVVPRSSEMLVFPAHLVRVSVREEVALGELDLQYYNYRSDGHGLIGDSTIDLVITGPSRIELQASALYEGTEAPGRHATMVVHLIPAGSDREVVIICELDQRKPNLFESYRSSVSIS